MPEPRAERIMAAVQTLLQGIVGDGGVNYWETPDPAGVIREPSFHGECLKKGAQVLYVISIDRVSRRQETNRQKNGEITFDVTVLKRLPTNFNENPFATGQTERETIQSRLAADCEKKLISDPAFNAFPGLEVWRVEVLDDDRSAENTNFEAWACAFLHCAINYRYPITEP
jgi:hypothetical protein